MMLNTAIYNQHRYVAIIDWDDTLYPTTAIKLSNLMDIETINNLCFAVYKTLLKIVSMCNVGNVYIVSNGSTNWINACIQNYCRRFKSLRDILSCITIVSSRDLFQLPYPQNLLKSKELCFEFILKPYVSILQPLTVLCFGDSNDEWRASDKVMKKLMEKESIKCDATLHRIKFMQKPSVIDVIRQHSETIHYLSFL